MAQYTYQQAAFATAVTASYTALVATTTAPATTTDGVFSTRRGSDGEGVQTFSMVYVKLYGAGSDNNTGSMRLWGWVRDNNATLPLWTPELLFEVDGTFSTLVGVASATVTNSMRFADTLALGTDDPGGPAVLTQAATANTCAAMVAIPIETYEFIQFDGKKGTGTNVNALMRMVGG